MYLTRWSAGNRADRATCRLGAIFLLSFLSRLNCSAERKLCYSCAACHSHLLPLRWSGFPASKSKLYLAPISLSCLLSASLRKAPTVSRTGRTSSPSSPFVASTKGHTPTHVCVCMCDSIIIMSVLRVANSNRQEEMDIDSPRDRDCSGLDRHSSPQRASHMLV